MSTPSLSLILFAVADAVAQGGLPEPADLYIYDDRELVLKFGADETGARAWATAAGVDLSDPFQWSCQPYTPKPGSSRAGQPFTLINGYGTWAGTKIRVSACVPVEASSAVAA